RQCCQAVGGVDDGVALGAQQAGDHFGHGGVVLYQQQVQGAAGGGGGVGAGGGGWGPGGGQRQGDVAPGAWPRRAVDVDAAAHGVGQFAADRQAQAAAAVAGGGAGAFGLFEAAEQ